MNLHGIASRYISTVNPMMVVTIQQSDGTYNITPDGTRTPNFNTLTTNAQIQSLTADELKQLDGLNLQGVKRAAYLTGDWRGVVRADGQGGDVMTFPDGTTWRVVLALETWPDWSKVAVCQQVGSP
jgi:hypothetical protein